MTKIHTEIIISSAHFVHTTNTRCRHLHGHNFLIKIDVHGQVKNDGMIIDFSDVKNFIKAYDHKLMLPEDPEIFSQEPPVLITSFRGKLQLDDHVLVILDSLDGNDNDKYYVFPKQDIIIVPVPVITAENLASFFAVEIARLVGDGTIEVEVWESEKSSAYAEAVGSLEMIEVAKNKIKDLVNKGERWGDACSTVLDNMELSNILKDDIWDWARSGLAISQAHN